MSTEERNVNEPMEEALSELRQVRRSKLKELQDAGRTPSRSPSTT